jgi:hypothetical protein
MNADHVTVDQIIVDQINAAHIGAKGKDAPLPGDLVVR